MMPRAFFFAVTLLGTVVTFACGNPAGAGPLPTGLSLHSGDGQTGTAGQLLPHPLVVTVGDLDGRGIEGAAIAWEVTSGGGTIQFISYTDASGKASSVWTLGWQGKTQTAHAKVSFFADSTPGPATRVTFTATANGAATDLLLLAGDNQSAIIDDTLPVPLHVRATDPTGRGVPGISILFAAIGGGKVFPNPAVSDAQGDAVATWVLGSTVGAQSVTAAAAGLSGSPTFTATANAAANTLTWVGEQLPSGSSIWAGSASDVFVVGGGGTIRHFNGSSWELQNSGTTNDLHVIWGSSSTDVYTGGTGGTILHYDGASWSPVAGTPSDAIYSIWASSPSDVFAVGPAGLWHSDGSVWTKQIATSSPGNCPLRAVWGSSDHDVWAIGHYLLHYDGMTWGSVPAVLCSYGSTTGIWGNGPTDLYIVGTNISFDGCTRGGGCPYVGFISHYDGANWHNRLNSREYAGGFSGVWAASSAEVVVVGGNGLILHSDGTRWRREDSKTTQAIVAVSGSSARDVWAITAGGLVLHGTR